MSDSNDNDFEPRSTGSKQQKRKRHIVMRIEFDDSDETSSSSASGADDDFDEKPTCSRNLRARLKKTAHKGDSYNNNNGSDESQDNIRRCLRNRHTNALNIKDSDEENSTSGSEIIRSVNARGKHNKNYILSEDERESISPKKPVQQQTEEDGFTSDSSSNELLEKCPICLLTFRQQEIGSPSTCEHIFCANCIEAWSKNVQTCPIDRLEFNRIIVRDSYENRNIVREINVDLGKSQKELAFDDETVEDEEVTNCEICNRPDREDVMLLCDSCNQGYHMDCLVPALTTIPEGSWYCDNCFDSQEENDGVEEDINLLFDDLRDMGIPEAHLRVTEVHQPRILRTRQNERIRAAILRRTRSTSTRTETTTTTTTMSRTRTRRQPQNSTLTTTTTTTRTTRSKNVPKKVRKTKKRRRRRARQRTYVVEYDLNNYDEKFAIKTSKKVIRRRRRKRAKTKADTGVRMTASKRLAEQLGVKQDTNCNSQLTGTGSAALSLMGNVNDLEYFSDSDNGDGIESQIEFNTGHGPAVQTSVRISSYGPQRSRKNILLGRLKRGAGILPTSEVNSNQSNPDILSSIMNIQNRWLNATRSLNNVRINADGTLNLQQNVRDQPSANSNTPKVQNADNNMAKNTQKSSTQTQPSVSPSNVTQAPMYPRGGGNTTNFNNSGGTYNNRFGNTNNYRNNSGGAGNQYRHSTGSSNTSNSNGGLGGGNFNSMVGQGNFNFGPPNFNNNQNQNLNLSFAPFSMRFNQRNQQNNQRNNNANQQQQQQQPMQIVQRRNSMIESNLFGGLPPPVSNQMDTQIFSGLSQPIGLMQPPQVQPPQLATNASMSLTPILSVPPPPAPPPGVQLPWNRSLFQINNSYSNEEETNCPNFSIYSAQSQEVAKCTDMSRQMQQNKPEAPKLAKLMRII